MRPRRGVLRPSGVRTPPPPRLSRRRGAGRCPRRCRRPGGRALDARRCRSHHDAPLGVRIGDRLVVGDRDERGGHATFGCRVRVVDRCGDRQVLPRGAHPQRERSRRRAPAIDREPLLADRQAVDLLQLLFDPVDVALLRGAPGRPGAELRNERAHRPQRRDAREVGRARSSRTRRVGGSRRPRRTGRRAGHRAHHQQRGQADACTEPLGRHRPSMVQQRRPRAPTQRAAQMKVPSGPIPAKIFAAADCEATPISVPSAVQSRAAPCTNPLSAK